MATGQPALEARGDGELQLNSAHKHIHTQLKNGPGANTHTKYIHSCIQQTARLTPKGWFIIEVLFQKGVFQLLVILLAPLQFEMNVLTLFAGQCASIIWKTCITVTLCAIWRHRGSVIAFFFSFPLKEHRNIQSVRRIVPHWHLNDYPREAFGVHHGAP